MTILACCPAQRAKKSKTPMLLAVAGLVDAIDRDLWNPMACLRAAVESHLRHQSPATAERFVQQKI